MSVILLHIYIRQMRQTQRIGQNKELMTLSLKMWIQISLNFGVLMTRL